MFSDTAVGIGDVRLLIHHFTPETSKHTFDELPCYFVQTFTAP